MRMQRVGSKKEETIVRKKPGDLKLMDIPEMSKIFCSCDDGSSYIIFHHLDGMYSYCETEMGNPTHIAVFQELKQVEGGYEFAEEAKDTKKSIDK